MHSYAPDISTAELFSSFVDRLKKAGVFHCEKDAAHIIAYVCGLEPNDYWEEPPIAALDQEKIDHAELLIQRRENREPLARVLGFTTFCKHRIYVEHSVFRPCDTSQDLVDYGVSLMKERQGPIRILDLGTGTGCFLISLLLELPNATGVGVDIKSQAINLAQRNAYYHNVSNRATFIASDWGKELDEKFDLIIGNLPPIAHENIPNMAPELKDFDPIESLSGGEDGLDAYRAIAADFQRLINDDGIGLFQSYATEEEIKIFKSQRLIVEVLSDFAMKPFCLKVTARPQRKKGTSFLRAFFAKLFGFLKRR